jgi:hypothetical protein
MDLLFEAHLSTTAYFTTFHSSVKGFENFFLMSFSSHLERVLMSYMGWGALGIELFGFYWFALPGETSLFLTTG